MEMSNKLRKYITSAAYTDILEQIIAGMLEFSGFPESVHTEFIPIYKMRDGLCAIVDDVDGGAVGHCALAGGHGTNGLYVNGWGRDAVVSFDNGIVKTYSNWIENPHVVVMFNDCLMRPDLNIGRTAEMLTHIDVSMLLNIIYSRYLPIPVANNADAQRAIDNALNALISGEKLKTILSDDILSDVLGQHNGVDIINISDVRNADKIQYLSMAHDDILRRFYQLYGMDVDGTGKMAQQTVAEIGSRQGASMIIPYNMYNEAKKAVEQINKKFGWNVSVKFGRPWEYDLNNNGVLDVVEDENNDDGAENNDNSAGQGVENDENN